jgi:hypothetical protein
MLNPFLHSEMDFKQQKIVISCKFMSPDWLNDALAINTKTSSFIPHLPQQLQANALGVPFKNSKRGIIINKGRN